uniref:Uncharacterized protein n=1 Tax=Arundo donax TaxID=35708 RepID=A0A0A9DLT1_ARUDO
MMQPLDSLLLARIHVFVSALDDFIPPPCAHSRDSLAIVKARTLTPFAMSSGDAYSSGLWL